MYHTNTTNNNTDTTDNNTTTNVLQIQGKLYDLSNGLYIDNVYNNRGHNISIYQQDGADKGTGHTLWDGSVILSKYFDMNYNVIRNYNVLELGSGCGLVGITLYKLGALYTLLSDLNYCLNNLLYNVKRNCIEENPNIINVTAIDWNNKNTYVYPNNNGNQLNWDIIVAADVVWIVQLIQPLVETLYNLSSFNTTIFISHQKRSEETDELFFNSLNRYFTITTIPHQEHHPLFTNPKINIYKAKRKI